MNTKHFFLTVFLLLSVFFASAQTATITTNGRYIIGNCGDTLILKGVNYAAYNWGYSNNQLRIAEIAQSGANAVRIPWYASGTPNLYADYTYLDSAISKCIQYDMIPIIDLHDQTCQNSAGSVIELSNFYTQPAILALIQKYKRSLIVNIANEALFVNWTADPVSATQIYQSTYADIIGNLRAQGIDVPLMIDGPDCGTNLDVLANVGNTLIANDPLQRLIFSAHGYWYAFANNDSATYLSKVNNALSTNIPFIFGEVANLQDDQTLCQYTLNYRPLLSICETKKIGWLAWSWDNDGCPQRQITSTGNFANLTSYGNIIVNNAVFGIKNTAKRSRYLLYNGCPATNIQPAAVFQEQIFLSETPEEIRLRSLSSELLSVEVYSMMGQNIKMSPLSFGEEIVLKKANFTPGVYVIKVESKGETTFRKVLL